MGSKSTQKGKRGEREVVNLARSHGIEADRTWASATHSDPTVRKTDVVLHGLRTQVKLAKSGFKRLYEALEGVEIAFVRADHKPWLVVLRAGDFLKMLRAMKTDGPRIEPEHETNAADPLVGPSTNQTQLMERLNDQQV